MPRYKYECKLCGATALVFHLMDEVYEDCEECEDTGSMIKLLSSSTTIKTKSKVKQPAKIGNLTKKFIEKNREILKQQKKETKGKTHDPT